MSVSTEMMACPARILPAPPISYASGNMTPADASWNLMRKKFKTGAVMSKWSYMIIEERFAVDVGRVIEIVQQFHGTCREYGMTVSPPVLKLADGREPSKVKLPQERNPADLENAMKPAFKRLMDSGIKIVYVFLPSQDKSVYAAVKYCGDTKAGVGTVCSQWSKVQKGSPQYLANIALKFNLKLGGTNHILQPPQLGPLAGGKTMIVSI
jgi:eukaryotic translation initiation factor 2C